MEEYTAKELFKLLNSQDECDWIEAKGGSESSQSVMETVCAFSNEPSLNGGYILLGVAEDKTSMFPQYKTVHISDPDKFQKDFVAQCSSMFNIPVRPKVTVEKISGDTVIKIKVNELSQNQKPLYFKKGGLPGGAYRRVGPTDQKCTEDDMHIFYADAKSYDQTPIVGCTLEDVDENAIKRYRSLREKVNAVAEELNYEDDELLEALGCVNKKNKKELNLAGLVLFGNSKALRAHLPMVRVDYIRVPGNEWVQNPDERFTTIDMRGPLLTLVFRLIEAINADLPKGFLLPEGEMQASSVGLPTKALREAIVNAVMHRSYREHRPVQVIRYDNRIEIFNPGYSLKSEELLGQPGSETRNPFIAAVFHETNLAETKGSGIRAMRKLMSDSHLAPPTFDSDRNGNQFVSRLLLHHFLDEKDLIWLQNFKEFDLNDGQKQALIFVREVGAIDNHSYRQMNDCDTLKSSTELRALKAYDLLSPKGKGKGTYYVLGSKLIASLQTLSKPPQDLSVPPLNHSEPVNIGSEPVREDLVNQFPLDIKDKLAGFIGRTHDKEKLKKFICELCAVRELSVKQLSILLTKQEKYLLHNFIKPMREEGKIVYIIPDMPNHPQQAYKTIKQH